jgi:hypothetical protein
LEPENSIGGQSTIRKQPEMAEPDRPPGQRSLFDFGMRRMAEKRPPPEVDQTEVERDVEAKRQAHKQREQDAAAAAAAAKRPVGRPKGSGKKSGPAVPGPAAAAAPQQLVWVHRQGWKGRVLGGMGGCTPGGTGPLEEDDEMG